MFPWKVNASLSVLMIVTASLSLHRSPVIPALLAMVFALNAYFRWRADTYYVT